MADKQDRVIVEMTIAAPAETVWRALGEPEQLMNWFGWDADTLRDEVQFIFFDHARRDDARKVLAFDEYEGSSDRVELVPTPGGTVLRVVRSGPAPEGDWSNFYEDTWEGWITFFEQLRFLVERHAGQQRRTVFLLRKLEAPGALPLAATGLVGFLDQPSGQEVSLALPTGEAVAGKLWHRSDRQVGITVPQWGDGLLVVTDKPAPNGGEHGGGSVLITSFGLADAEFSALESRWRNWWDGQ